MISLRAVKHRYAGGSSIEFADWNISRGEKWLMLGDSGSGKTTLLHILSGLLEPREGEVIINETSLYSIGSRQLDRFRGRNLGLIFQVPHLIKSLTISENLLIAQTFAGFPADGTRVNEILDSLGIYDKKQKYPRQLSQGQLQRVSIARAAINKPSILIADEPTSSLDDRHTSAVLDLLLSQA